MVFYIKDYPDGDFYLTPLNNEKAIKVPPIGHNVLQKMIPNLFEAVGLEGHFTNHSLSATSAMQLLKAQIGEMLIM